MNNKNIFNKKIKEIFDRIGIEQAPSDFTANVMSRIQVEPGIITVKAKPVKSYILYGILILSVCLAIVFSSNILSYANDLLTKLTDIDYSFVSNIFTSITETIEGYSVSSTGLVILSLSIIFFSTTIIVNFQRYYYNLQRITLSA